MGAVKKRRCLSTGILTFTAVNVQDSITIKITAMNLTDEPQIINAKFFSWVTGRPVQLREVNFDIPPTEGRTFTFNAPISIVGTSYEVRFNVPKAESIAVNVADFYNNINPVGNLVLYKDLVPVGEDNCNSSE